MGEDSRIEACARAAHEFNRAYCLHLGDGSQLPWEDAPQWQRDSCIAGVHGVLTGNTPEQSHESWLAEKERTGWRYGPVKDPDRKEHPCIMPYQDLPEAQRRKDHGYIRVVSTMAQMVGLQPPFEGA